MLAKYSLLRKTNIISQIQYDKIFNMYQKHNKKHHIFNLCIKIIDNTIYVYIKDIIINHTQLIHTTYTNLNSIFIQLTNDYQYLSLPENNDIHIYDLSQILTDNILIKKHIITLTNYEKVSKCMLYEKYFMFVASENLTIINLESNIINKLAIDNNFKISSQGELVVYHTNSIYDTNNNRNYSIKLNNMLPVDNNFLFQVENTTFKLYDIKENKTHIYQNNVVCDKYNIVKYKNDIYIIYGYKSNLLVYWIYYEQNINGPYYINLHISKCEFMNDNGLICIYKTNNLIYVYNFNDIMAVQLLLTRSTNIKKQIQCIAATTRQIVLIGCDEISIEYTLNNYMNSFIETLDTKFELQYNININIYNKIKSFNLFQDLINNKIHITNIIKNIFDLNDLVSIHNTTTELLNHFYDYTYSIVLKDMTYYNTSKNGQAKILYIGYIILAFITQYHITLFSLVDISIINYDILNTYKDIFPIFIEHIPDIFL